jgi:hypothetical protein
MSTSRETLLNEHLVAENAHDLERIMATYGESPLIVLNGQRIEGHAAIREFHCSFATRSWIATWLGDEWRRTYRREPLAVGPSATATAQGGAVPQPFSV